MSQSESPSKARTDPLRPDGAFGGLGKLHTEDSGSYGLIIAQSMDHDVLRAQASGKDGEVDHLKAQKRQILDTLFPDWHGTDFNPDAPVLSSMMELLRLQSIESVRPDVPRLLLDSNGEMYCTKIREAFVRDNKNHLDSLQRLPSLSELLHGLGSVERWGHVYNKCYNLDMSSKAVRKVQESSIRHEDNKSITGSRAGSGVLDHVEELQPGAVVKDGVPCHDFEAAATLLASVAHKGWSGYN
ncbi:hypothetical protein E4U58_004099 [Claviceps cyperi]|nr:hypothetical protein E4U58_004099 [Claviceps cyperi]